MPAECHASPPSHEVHPDRLWSPADKRAITTVALATTTSAILMNPAVVCVFNLRSVVSLVHTVTVFLAIFGRMLQ